MIAAEELLLSEGVKSITIRVSELRRMRNNGGIETKRGRQVVEDGPLLTLQEMRMYAGCGERQSMIIQTGVQAGIFI